MPADLLAAVADGGTWSIAFADPREREQLRSWALRVGRNHGVMLWTRARGQAGTLTVRQSVVAHLDPVGGA